MAELELITGRTGEQHVLAIDDAEIYRTLLGNGDFVLSTGHKLEARMNGANKVDIYDGTAIMQGRQMKIRSGFQELETDGGVTGFRREDAIVLEYSKSGDIETVQLKVIKGANDANVYKPPALIQGNIDSGQTRQARLWGVRYNGINFDSLIDYRVILNTTPIQTALDTATSGLANIQQVIAAYQSQIEARLDDLRNVVRVAPLMTVTGHGLTAEWNVVKSSESFHNPPKGGGYVTVPLSNLGFSTGDEINGRMKLSNDPDRLHSVRWGQYGVNSGGSYWTIYDNGKTLRFNNSGSRLIVGYEIFNGTCIVVPASGYTFGQNDVFIVYVNGLKMPVDQYSVIYEDGNLRIVSDEFGFGNVYDDVELEIWRPEEA